MKSNFDDGPPENHNNKRLEGWKHELKTIIDEHNSTKVSGRGSVSYRTRDKRKKMLFKMFNTLRTDLNYKIENPANLKEKHIEALVKHWIDAGLSAGTIDNNLSVLRTLCSWMGKVNMVKSLADYAPGMRRTYAAQTDKSWSGNGVDFWAVWDKVCSKDKNVGMQLLLVAALGARRKEAVMFRPIVYGHEHYIELLSGTKNGRGRTVPVDDDFKRTVVATLKQFVLSKSRGVKGHIGNPDKNLEQNLSRYDNVLRRCGVSKAELGVTGHGLRAEFVIDELEKRGLVPTIRGGSGKASTQFETDLAYFQVAEAVGHSRKSVMTAYSGKLVVKAGELVEDDSASTRLSWKHDAHKTLSKKEVK